MAKTALVAELPPCDFHDLVPHHGPAPAVYDAATRQGPWAHMCAPCMRDNGAVALDQLGTGKGQRLVRLPRVGDGASIRVGTDSYAAVVVRVTESGKTVTVRHAETDKPGRDPGGYGWERFASEDALKHALEHGTGVEKQFTLRDETGVYVKKGEPARGGRKLRVGVAREYRDPHV